VRETYKGATLVSRVEDTYGYITDADVFAKDIAFLECSLSSPKPTTFKKLYTKTYTLYYVTLNTGFEAVYAEETNVVGNYAQSGQEDRGSGLEAKWFLRNGEIERQVKRHVLEEQTDDKLCKRDQAWLIVDTLAQKYGFLNGGQFSLIEDERNWYTADKPLNEAYKSPRGWTKYIKKARYDQPTGDWVETPVVAEPGTQPPAAVFVKPLLTPVVTYGESEIWEPTV
jgi:hypothetical protein